MVAQLKALDSVSTIDSLPTWYWNTKMQGHFLLHHTFFRCGLHHYDGNGKPDKDCPAGRNCNDCFLSGVYSDYFDPVSIKVVIRTIKAASDKPVWCSSIGDVYEGKDPRSGAKNGINIKALAVSDPDFCQLRNVPRALMQSAEDWNIKQLFYYRASADDDLSSKYPTWRAKDIHGNDLKFANSRSDYLCVNTPYADALNTRIVELVAQGAHGIYIDNYHNPVSGCWCASCTAKYQAIMGGSIPEAENDPRMISYYNKIIYKHIWRLQNTIHNTPNDTQTPSIFIGSVGRFLMLNQAGINKDFVKLLDVPKAEYSHPLRLVSNKYFYSRNSKNALQEIRIPNSIRLGFAWSVLRDYATHRTFSAWIEPEYRFEPKDSSYKQIPIPKEQLTSYLGAAYAFGFTIDPSLYVNSKEDVRRNPSLILGGVPNEDVLQNYKEVFAIDNKLGPIIADKMPLKWNAILFDSDIKNRYLKNIVGAAGVTYLDELIDQNGLWEDYLIASHAAFEAVKNYSFSSDTVSGSYKQPVFILDHDELLNGEVSGIRNILVPNKQLLSEDLLAALESFEAKGDRCIIYLDDVSYYNKRNTGKRQESLLGNIFNRTVEASARKSPIYLKGHVDGAKDVFVEFYGGSADSSSVVTNIIVAMTNNISWSVPVALRRPYVQNKALTFSDQPDAITDLNLKPPPPISSDALTIRIDPKIRNGLLDQQGNLSLQKLQLIDLRTGEDLKNNVSFDSKTGEIVVAVPGFDLLSVIGIRFL